PGARFAEAVCRERARRAWNPRLRECPPSRESPSGGSHWNAFRRRRAASSKLRGWLERCRGISPWWRQRNYCRLLFRHDALLQIEHRLALRGASPSLRNWSRDQISSVIEPSFPAQRREKAPRKPPPRSQEFAGPSGELSWGHFLPSSMRRRTLLRSRACQTWSGFLFSSRSRNFW